MDKISREELMQKANLSMDELVQVAGGLDTEEQIACKSKAFSEYDDCVASAKKAPDPKYREMLNEYCKDLLMRQLKDCSK